MSILIHNCTAVLMDEAGTVLPNAYVVVEGTKIRSVSTQRPWGSFEEQIDGRGNVLMPGFVNAHSHVPMTAMRGYGDGNNLQDWLHNYIFPVEARWDDRAIRACTDLGLAEMIASGVTCVADMYMHTGTIAEQILEAGISANLSCGGVYFGAPEDFSPEKCNDCRNQQELTQQWHGAGDGQILVDASIHAEYTSNPPLWQWMADYAAQHKLGMQVHISETRLEHESCLEKYGKTPIALLDQYGVPYQRPAGGHAIFVDAKKVLPNLPKEQFIAQTLAVELYLEAGIRGVEIGSILADRDPETHENRYPALELLRLAIPRRVYTDNHIRVIAAACRNIFERRAEITTGYRITFEAPILRHFTVELDKIR